MTESVTIKHPTAGTSKVAPSAVPHWRSLGWELVEDAPAEPAGAQKKEKASGRSRRRTSEESEK